MEAFEVEESEPVEVGQVESERTLSILSVVFTEGNKWRFTDGESTFAAAIEDGTFLARVKEGESFQSGDMLRCQLREVQSEKDGTLHMERSILEVVEHIRAKPQLTLDPGEGSQGHSGDEEP